MFKADLAYFENNKVFDSSIRSGYVFNCKCMWLIIAEHNFSSFKITDLDLFTFKKSI